MSHFAFVLPSFVGGGAERVALALISEFLARDHKIDLVLGKAVGELLPLVPKQVRIVDLKAGKLREVVGPLKRYFREERPDAVQVSMWPLTALSIVAHRLSGIETRLVVSDHMSLSHQYGGSFRDSLFLRWTVRFLYPLADRRIVVSKGAASDILQLSGLDPSLFDVVYNPIPERNQVSGSLGDVESLWPGDGKRILSVGTLKPQKNHALLLRAFEKVSRTRNVSLLILGEGELRNSLEELTIDLGISQQVAMPGFYIDPGPVYDSADVFVLSSDYEGFGNVVVEALQAGLPVVSTDCPSGPAEILEFGEHGRLTPPGDAELLAESIIAALDHPPPPESQRGRAAEFSVQKAADAYEALMLGQD